MLDLIRRIKSALQNSHADVAAAQNKKANVSFVCVFFSFSPLLSLAAHTKRTHIYHLWAVSDWHGIQKVVVSSVLSLLSADVIRFTKLTYLHN